MEVCLGEFLYLFLNRKSCGWRCVCVCNSLHVSSRGWCVCVCAGGDLRHRFVPLGAGCLLHCGKVEVWLGVSCAV